MMHGVLTCHRTIRDGGRFGPGGSSVPFDAIGNEWVRPFLVGYTHNPLLVPFLILIVFLFHLHDVVMSIGMPAQYADW